MCNFQVTYVGCADFPVFLFLIEGIKCFIPCDLAPGLSLPYPSSRLMTPHAASPAPMAQTSVFKVVIAVVKNPICVCPFFKKGREKPCENPALCGNIRAGFLLWKIRHCAAGTYILADGVPAAFFQWHPLFSSFHFATTCREAAGLLVTSHRLPPYHPVSARDWC